MKKHEKAVRDAAAALHEAITDARAAGLVVGWPLRVDGLTTMAISETAKANVTVGVDADGVDPKTVAKAATAAQKAADKVVGSDKA
jgi:hypothetical protein